MPRPGGFGGQYGRAEGTVDGSQGEAPRGGGGGPPLEYADFEGTIPQGEYGAGRVLVWDAGPYRNPNWLLVKMKDSGADARRKPTRTEPESVLSGRTLEEVRAEEAEQNDDEGSS